MSESREPARSSRLTHLCFGQENHSAVGHAWGLRSGRSFGAASRCFERRGLQLSASLHRLVASDTSGDGGHEEADVGVDRSANRTSR